MSNYLAILVLLMLPLFSDGQKLVEDMKKKYFGTYSGEIPSYNLDTGNDVVEVESTQLIVKIDDTFVQMDLGKEHFSGTYQVLFQGDDYYVLDVRLEGQSQLERFIVHMKSKSLSREGIYPQPNAELKKLSKKEMKNL